MRDLDEIIHASGCDRPSQSLGEDILTLFSLVADLAIHMKDFKDGGGSKVKADGGEISAKDIDVVFDNMPADNLILPSKFAQDFLLDAEWLRTEALANRLPHLLAGRTILFNRDAVVRVLAERASRYPNNRDSTP